MYLYIFIIYKTHNKHVICFIIQIISASIYLD